MAFTISFGSYLPGETAVHRCDARVKFLIAVAYTYAIFASSTWWAQLALAVLMLLGYLIAKVPFKIALRGLKPITYILIFTIIANAFTFHAGDIEGALVLIGGFGIRPWGLLAGVYFVVRISLLILATSLLTFTTSAIRLSDGLASLMKPLGLLKVPVNDVATMFSIALRFIPTTAEEANRIMIAQKARGARFDEGNIMHRVMAWVPVLIPLFVGLFRRADELAAAMEARCYTGEGRTRLNVAVMRPVDWVILVVACLLLIAIGVFL